MKYNVPSGTDSYKLTHYGQYPEGTERVYSYFEARKGARFDTTVFIGLQYLLKEYFSGVVVTKEGIDRAEAICKAHFGSDKIFNRAGWEHILNEHGGVLPILIRAIPEGTPVPINNAMLTIENLDPKCFWLTNHMETVLTHLWYPSTVATLSREVKKVCKKYLEKTSDNMGGLEFMLHDFGYRGTECVESAGFGGFGHLPNFFGTDTVAAMEVAVDYYNGNPDFTGIAYSVPATEHSVMTSLGREGEMEMVQRVLDLYPTGIVSIVNDSYDTFEHVRQLGTRFKDQILARDGKVVTRPDSGDPVSTTLKTLAILEQHFGATVNSKGYKVLNPKVGILWGDGIDIKGVEGILNAMRSNGWSAENIVFGMGGALLQKVNRDTQRFAFKCCAQLRNGEWVDIQKNPLDTSKASKKGRLKLINYMGQYKTVAENTVAENEVGTNLLQKVFENGKVLVETNLNEIRERAKL